jgi:hypothetical protein
MIQRLSYVILFVFAAPIFAHESAGDVDVNVDCSHAAYPNPGLTPGWINPQTSEREVCTPGFTKSVRKHFSEEEQHAVFVRYNMEHEWETNRDGYEIDHLISLELGGSNDIRNLWPQPYEPKPAARQKDVVETHLKHQICKGELTMEQAQHIITTDWCAAYKQIRLERSAKRRH